MLRTVAIGRGTRMGASVGNTVRDIEHALRGLQNGPGRVVLIVEPSPDHQAKLARLLAVRGHRAIGTTSIDGALAFLRAFPVDLVLLAEEVAGDSPLRVVAELIGRRPNARIVIMTPPLAADAARSMTRAGMAPLEYMPRSFDGETLAALLPG
jgi:ActR/RegA family two-component response regulator